jgi:hypothetical protein
MYPASILIKTLCLSKMVLMEPETRGKALATEKDVRVLITENSMKVGDRKKLLRVEEG